MTEAEKKQRRRLFAEQSEKDIPEHFNNPVIEIDVEEQKENWAGIKLHGQEGVLVECVLMAVSLMPNVYSKLSYICETDNNLHVGWQKLPHDNELVVWDKIRKQHGFNSIEHGYGDEIFVLENGKMYHK